MVTSPVPITPSVVIALAVLAMIAAYIFACCVVLVRREMSSAPDKPKK